MRHYYKGYIMLRNGTKEYPWNIYKLEYSTALCKEVPTHVGFEKTIRDCKAAIDDPDCILTEI